MANAILDAKSVQLLNEASEERKGNGTVKAVLERIVWRKDRYIIGIAKPDGRRPIGVLGNMADPQEGQLYEFTGRWQRNDRFNKWDLHFSTYRTILPNDDQSIYHYLVRTAKWVGPETAEKLIARYGADTLSVLKNDPRRVIADQIHGLTLQRVEEMSKSLRDNERLEAVQLEVDRMIGGALGRSIVEKAIGKWGADAGHIIRRDPYRLMKLNGIGFVKADQVAMKLGIPAESRRRHAHAMLHVLSEQAAQNGHTRVAPLRFQAEVQQLIGDPHPKALRLCERAKRVQVTPQYVADAELGAAEQFIADKLRALCMQDLPPLLLTENVKELAETLEDEQRTAFNQAQVSPLLIVTGAPGTGKTYTVARIIAMWQENNLRIALAAPTGKAAKQMELALSQTVGLPARTIHSLLEAEVVDDVFRFQRNADNPLDCNALVIDETSMVDVRLMLSLLAAVPDECRILLVGDHYQLPSVGPGAVLRDILAAGLPNVELTKIKRNAGRIVRACHAMKDGGIPEPAPKLNLPEGDNWRHIDASTDSEIIEVVRVLLRKKLPDLGIDPVWQTQIISPTNERGSLSCAVLNRVAKEIVNPGPFIDKLAFSMGDKIVRTKNGKVATAGYSTCSTCDGTGETSPGTKCLACVGRGKISQGGEVRIVNGDIGVIKEVDEKFIYVDFLWPDRSVKIPRREHHLRQAYCMTCHKMQGSEIDVVILPITKALMGMPMVTREWVYTAMSRAKKFILTVGNLDYLPMALRRIGNTARVTALAELLQEYEL